MADMDMKQKIKEVRDKFLSNNQIEDIRQNITLGVEERLKFLNTEQIKVVELLEEKHRELNSALQEYEEKSNTNSSNIESKFSEKTEDLEKKLNKQAERMEIQTLKHTDETTELEARIKSTLKKALDEQAVSLKSTILELSDDIKRLKAEIAENETSSQERLLKNNSYLETSLSEYSSKMKETQETSEKMFGEETKKLENTVDRKLSSNKAEQKIFLQNASETFSHSLSELDKKIEAFLKNHQTVEDVIDSRLKEFRTAQKAAFEELEAALTLLERHQDETINRFKNKSELGISKHINLPNSSLKNRGSILHHAKEQTDETISTIEKSPTSSAENEKILPRSSYMGLYSLIGLAFLIVLYLIKYADIDYEKMLSLTSIF